MSEELYTYYNTIISVTVSTKGGRDLVNKEQMGVCADWWLKLDTCVKRVGIFCPLLVSCVASRGLAALVSVGTVL
jgi:hypothetical protein